MVWSLVRLQTGLWLLSLSARCRADAELPGAEDAALASALAAEPVAPAAPVNGSGFLPATPLVDSEYLEDRRLQQQLQQFPCRPARRPATYGRISSLPPARILECVRVPTSEIFGVNAEIVDISYGRFGEMEALLLSQKRASTHYLEVVPQGDYKHYEVLRAVRKKFADHSCLNQQMWCFTAQVKPVSDGLLVVDRHRLISYNYTWIIEDNTPAADIPKVFVSQFGAANVNEIGASPETHLYFPTAVGEYKPFSQELVAPGYNITSLIPHAWCRLLFVTDTGNHRVVMLNATLSGQFDYMGQFGQTGVQIDAANATLSKTGLNWPWGIAVQSPAAEALYEPVYANVFVVDRRNHRLVKFNLGYPLLPCNASLPDSTGPLVYDAEEEVWLCRRYDKPRLTFSSEYGRAPDALGRPRGLTDPVAVGIYRHYIAVCEVGGNAITLLTVDHQPPYALKLVTYFKPVQGISLRGGMAVSEFGYIWYNYLDKGNKFYFSSMITPESIRESKVPNRLEDFLKVCVNRSWYDSLIPNRQAYLDQVGFILNTSRINWVFPDRSDYFDISSFNTSGIFDLNLLNQLVYNGTMIWCEEPTTPKPPAFMSGNSGGWVIDGQSQSEFARRSGAPRSSYFQAAFLTTCLSVFLLFTLS